MGTGEGTEEPAQEPTARPKNGLAEPIPWWAAIGLTVGAVTLSAMLSSASVFVRAFRGIPIRQAAQEVTSDPLALGLAQAAAFGLVIFVTVQLFATRRSLRETLAVRFNLSTRSAALLVMMGLALQFPFSELSNLAHQFWPVPLADQQRVLELLTTRTLGESLSVIIAIVIIAPVVEEVFFRGALFEGLQVRYGATFAIIITAVLFGVSHGSIGASIYATVAGLLFGALRLRTDSVVPGVVLHASVNAVPVLLSPAVIQLPGFNVASAEAQHLPWWILVSASAIAVLAAFAFLHVYRDEALPEEPTP